MLTEFLHARPVGNSGTEYRWRVDDQSVQRFHQSLPGFRRTPLVELPRLARALRVGRIFVKDESQRLGLRAFKVLGVAYAVARLLARELDLDHHVLEFQTIRAEVQRRLKQVTLATATDGNHGKGLAWIAAQLGLQSMIYLPAGASVNRRRAIEALGGATELTDLNYDAAVRYAAHCASQRGWWMVQDTAWLGYEQVPAWIMEGYITMAREAHEQLLAVAAEPTHLLLQAGVGSMAAAVQSFWLSNCSGFKTVIMEPTEANCYYRSMQANDARAHALEGNLETIMAGLSCGEPNSLAWPLLRDTVSSFASCPDGLAALGMRILGNPLCGDPAVEAGESGAVGIGLLAALSWQPELFMERRRLGLNEESVVLAFNTEGATDPDKYRQIVWGGEYPWLSEFVVLNQ